MDGNGKVCDCTKLIVSKPGAFTCDSSDTNYKNFRYDTSGYYASLKDRGDSLLTPLTGLTKAGGSVDASGSYNIQAGGSVYLCWTWYYSAGTDYTSRMQLIESDSSNSIKTSDGKCYDNSCKYTVQTTSEEGTGYDGDFLCGEGPKFVKTKITQSQAPTPPPSVSVTPSTPQISDKEILRYYENVENTMFYNLDTALHNAYTNAFNNLCANPLKQNKPLSSLSSSCATLLGAVRKLRDEIYGGMVNCYDSYEYKQNKCRSLLPYSKPKEDACIDKVKEEVVKCDYAEKDRVNNLIKSYRPKVLAALKTIASANAPTVTPKPTPSPSPAADKCEAKVKCVIGKADDCLSDFVVDKNNIAKADIDDCFSVSKKYCKFVEQDSCSDLLTQTLENEQREKQPSCVTRFTTCVENHVPRAVEAIKNLQYFTRYITQKEQAIQALACSNALKSFFQKKYSDASFDFCDDAFTVCYRKDIDDVDLNELKPFESEARSKKVSDRLKKDNFLSASELTRQFFLFIENSIQSAASEKEPVGCASLAKNFYDDAPEIIFTRPAPSVRQVSVKPPGVAGSITHGKSSGSAPASSFWSDVQKGLSRPS